MKTLLRALFLLWFCAIAIAGMAQACHYGEGGAGLNADLKALRAKPTCQEAYALYRKCLWGSSADPARADVVVEKCQAALHNKLTGFQQAVLSDKLNLCSLEYKDMDGTLWLSEASSCALAVYVDFATDLTKASQPIPRASFDCTRAQTPLERTVCTDPRLGSYDLLMANAYKSFLGELKGEDEASLLQNQRAWNAGTPTACPLKTAQPTSATVTCLRARYHDRMQALNGCAAGADVSCLDAWTKEP